MNHLLAIRADAGGALGTGHIMRTLALAQANRRRGAASIFIIADSCPAGIRALIHQNGYDYHVITTERLGDKQDAALTLDLAKNAAWLVLDGYHFDEAYQQLCQSAQIRTLCIDDYGHCSHWHCDALLNQNLGSENFPQPNLPPIALRGIGYALLREEFLRYPKRPYNAWGAISKLLVTLGGSDPQNATAWVLQQLNRLHLRDLNIKVIIGPANPHTDALLALDFDLDIEWVHSCSDMPACYGWADGVISAGGSSCWEWLSMGLPGAIVTIADNQLPTVEQIEREQLALCLGWPDQDLNEAAAQRLIAWLQSPQSCIDGATASQLIDGRGADRVMGALEGSGCYLSTVQPDADARFLFELSNSPAVRSAGFQTEPIPWETHLAWLTRHHLSPDSQLYLIRSCDSPQPIGFLRFHHQHHACWEIGISLTAEAQGKGYASNAVRLGMAEMRHLHAATSFLATVRPFNTASRQLFSRLGFVLDSTTADRELWLSPTPI